MPSKPINEALGLYRTPNPLGAAQDGGYQELTNCVIPTKSVVEPRRGQSQVDAWVGSINDTRRINALFASSVGMLAQYGSGTTSGVASLDASFATAILSDVDPPSVINKARFADCAKRCYVTTDGGVKRIDSTLTGRAAGGFRPILGNGNLSNPVYSASGQLPLNSAVNYRALLVLLSPDGAEIVGPPSDAATLRIPPVRTAVSGEVDRVSNVVTVVTTEPHGFKPAQQVYATFNAADTGAGEFDDGLKEIASVPSGTSFTYAETDTDYESTAEASFTLGPAVGAVMVVLPKNSVGVVTCPAGTLVRLYRSESTSSWQAVPSDDVYQVYEAKLTATDISNGYKLVADNTPEVLLGAPAYFSPSVEGMAGINDPPPLARDVTAFGDVVMLGHLTYPHRFEFRLLATSAAAGTGLQVGDTLTFARGVDTFTLDAVLVIPSDGEFTVFSGDTVARDIEATAQSLVQAINLATANTIVRASYVSDADDAPGIIFLEARDFSATAITVVSSRGTVWAPYLLNTGTAAASTQEIAPADVAFSKSGQPDAFPPLQRFTCGAQSRDLQRIIALREKVIVLKEDSAYLVSGSWPNFRPDPLDDSCNFSLPNTAVAMDNQVFALSSIGVVAVSESGVAQMGSPITNDFRAVIEQGEKVKALVAAGNLGIHCLAAWACADELEHRYILASPAAVGVPSATPTTEQKVDNIWVYNATGRAWSGPWPTKHRDAAMWKGASSSGRLVFARDDRPGVLREVGVDAEEVLQFSDYLGETLWLGPIDDGANIHLFTSGSGMPTNGTLEEGDALYVTSTGFFATVTQIVSNTTVYVDTRAGFGSGEYEVRVLKGYRVRPQWVVQTGDVAAEKRLSAVNLSLDKARFYAAKVSTATELSAEADAKTLSRRGFGSGVFGETPFGDGPGLLKERCAAAGPTQIGMFHSVALTVREAGAFFRLMGISLDFEVGSPKAVR